MKFSIITVVYNTGEKLVGTLDSVCLQKYQDYEVVIVDGCSNDKTLEVANSYQDRLADLIIVSEPDKGIYDAMNKGVRLAKGDYIYFLNAGDLLYDNEVLANVANHLIDKKLIYGNAITKNEDNEEIPYRIGAFSKYRLAHTNICHQTIFYPREALLEYPFNLNYRLFADWDVNMKLWKKVQFCYVEQNIVLYEGGGVSYSQKDKQFKKDQLKLITSYLGVDAIAYLIFRKMKSIWK